MKRQDLLDAVIAAEIDLARAKSKLEEFDSPKAGKCFYHKSWGSVWMVTDDVSGNLNMVCVSPCKISGGFEIGRMWSATPMSARSLQKHSLVTSLVPCKNPLDNA